MEINIHFGLINKSACAHAHSHYFPKWVLLFYCLYPQKTELVSTAKLPLGNGWIVHLRESDKYILLRICSGTNDLALLNKAILFEIFLFCSSICLFQVRCSFKITPSVFLLGTRLKLDYQV